MDSRKFGSTVLATVSITDEHLDVFNRVANALNKQRPGRASAMARLLEEALVELDADIKVSQASTVVPIMGTFDASKYFVTRKGLYLSSDFISRISLADKGLIPNRGINGVESINLTSNMHDSQIVAKYLGGMQDIKKSAFAPDQLATLIDAQEGGKDGLLLKNGSSTILYMLNKEGLPFSVGIDWDPFHSGWNIDAYHFGSGLWKAGGRLLRNTK